MIWDKNFYIEKRNTYQRYHPYFATGEEIGSIDRCFLNML